MNGFKKNLLIGMTVLGLGSAAFAASDTAGGAGNSGQGRPAQAQKHDPAKFKERMEKRRAELHDKLKLAPNQEAAWNQFAASMTPAMLPAQRDAKRVDRAELEKLTAPERLEKRLEWSKQRQDVMASRLSSMKTFYAQLNPEQQKIFNEHFSKQRHFGRGHGRHGRDGQRGDIAS